MADERYSAARRMVDSQYTVIQKLRWIREQNHLTQEDVAKRMGSCVPTVVRIETGDADLRVSTLRRYALACGGEVAFRASAQTIEAENDLPVFRPSREMIDEVPVFQLSQEAVDELVRRLDDWES